MASTSHWSCGSGRETLVCGIGAHTPVGMGWMASAAAVRAGISAIEADPSFVDKAGDRVRVARARNLATGLDVGARIIQLLLSAMEEAVDLSSAFDDALRLECWVGLPDSRPGIPARLTGDVVTAIGREFAIDDACVRVLPYGHAAGLMAMQAAAQRVSEGHADVCVAAGADSYLDWDTLEWLDKTGRLMSSANRNGFPPGEGAAACVVASADACQRSNLPRLARLVAASTAIETQSALTSDAVCTGEGLTMAIAAVTEGVLSNQRITAIYCDLNGERHRNEEFAYALLRTQDAFVNPHDYVAPCDCWGDIGAASGPLYAALAVASAQRGYAQGALPLFWSASDAGHRCATVLQLHAPLEVAAP